LVWVQPGTLRALGRLGTVGAIAQVVPPTADLPKSFIIIMLRKSFVARIC